MSDARDQSVGGPGGEAAAAARAAARERQSHVRHELRGPLAVMVPALQLLLDGAVGPLNDAQREHLEALERSVGRLERYITGAADSGWADCSAAPVIPEDVDLGVVADEVLHVRRLLRLGPPDPILVRAPEAPAARADRDDLRQILGDLIDNACAYAAAGDIVVRTGAGSRTGTVRLSVEDTGPGMTAAELGRAFDFGYRGEAAAAAGVAGLGAGLWIARELARRNGGDLLVEPGPPGAGLAVIVELPEAEGPGS